VDEPDWPDFTSLFVKEPGYSPQMLEKSNSVSLTLVTIAVLGQAPSQRKTTGSYEPDRCAEVHGDFKKIRRK
jgi:hypothetical protein